MDSAEIKELVRNRYGSIAAASSSCCGPEQAKASRMGYTDEELQAVPEGANLGLGCGNPQAIAALRPGEVLTDLGSGAGFDCLLAARKVGPEGRVIGIDMTHEMLAKARDNAARVGAGNVEFRLGELEHLPIADGTGDVIISNCVINLVPDKAVNINPLPPDLASDKALLCVCVAGAAASAAIEDWLKAAGFTDISIQVKPESREYVATWAAGRGIENYVASATIEARKPAAACCAPDCCT